MALNKFRRIRQDTGHGNIIIIDEIVNPALQVVGSQTLGGQLVLLEIQQSLQVRTLPAPLGGMQPLGSYGNLFAGSFIAVTDTEVSIVPNTDANQEDPRPYATQRFTIPSGGSVVIRIVNDSLNQFVEFFEYALDFQV